MPCWIFLPEGHCVFRRKCLPAGYDFSKRHRFAMAGQRLNNSENFAALPRNIDQKLCKIRILYSDSLSQEFKQVKNNRCAPVSTVLLWHLLTGTFNSEQGATSLDACKPCTAGKYCRDPGSSVESGSIEGGYYSASGAISPKPVAGKNWSFSIVRQRVAFVASLWLYRSDTGTLILGFIFVNQSAGYWQPFLVCRPHRVQDSKPR